MQIEGSGGLEVPYLGYVEVQLKISEVKAFDQDVLLLIVPDSAHTKYTPITLGTLHIDMAIKLATVYKNNRYFDLSSTYFLYPLASLPKMVKQEMPASTKQS